MSTPTRSLRETTLEHGRYIKRYYVKRNAHGKIVYDGVMTVWLKNGKKFGECTFRNGKIHGPCTMYYGRRKILEWFWKNDKPNGPFTEWHLKGRKRKQRQATYKNGKLEGLCTVWGEDGKKTRETIFRNDKKVKEREF